MVVSFLRGRPLSEPLGNWIRRRRIAAGLSQQAFAERIGVSQPVLSRLEQGNRAKVSAELAGKIAGAFAVSLDEVLEIAGLLHEEPAELTDSEGQVWYFLKNPIDSKTARALAALGVLSEHKDIH